MPKYIKSENLRSFKVIYRSIRFQQSQYLLKFKLRWKLNLVDFWHLFFLLLSFKGISKFQNSAYKVHQVGSNEACNQNFSFLALNTAELAAPKISSENLRQRRVTYGNFLSIYTRILGIKSPKTWKFAIKKFFFESETNTFHISYVEIKKSDAQVGLV
jgi:hypothetical protein